MTSPEAPLPFLSRWLPAFLAGSSFGRKAVQTVLARFISVTAAFLVVIYTSRIFGPEGRGLYALALAVVMGGVQLGNCGLQTANIFFAARHRELIPALFGNSLMLSLVSGGVLSLGFLAVATLRPEWVALPQTVIAMVCLWIPIQLLFLLLQHLLLGLDSVRWYNLLEVGIKTSAVGGIAILYLSGWNQMVPLLGMQLGIATLATAFAARKSWTLAGGQVGLSGPLLRRSLWLGIRLQLGAVFFFLLMKLDLFVVNASLGKAQAGFYSIASFLKEFLVTIPGTFVPILAGHLMTMPDLETRWGFLRRLLPGVSLGMAGLCGLVWIGLPWAIPVFLGSGFQEALAPAQWVLPGLCCTAVEMFTGTVLVASGHPFVILLPIAVFTLVYGLMAVVFCGWWGIAGAAVASSATAALFMLSSFAFLAYYRRHPESIRAVEEGFSEGLIPGPEEDPVGGGGFPGFP